MDRWRPQGLVCSWLCVNRYLAKVILRVRTNVLFGLSGHQLWYYRPLGELKLFKVNEEYAGHNIRLMHTATSNAFTAQF